MSCWKTHPDVSSSLWCQGCRGTADSSIFVSSWHYCRRRKNRIKTWHRIHKVLSFKLDYKVTIGDCHNFFLICLERRTYLMLNSFHVLIKSQVLFTDISVSYVFFSGVLTSTLALLFSIWVQNDLQSNIMDLFFCVCCPNTYHIVHPCPSQWIYLQFTGTVLSVQ